MKLSTIAACALILAAAGCGPRGEQSAQDAAQPANAAGPPPTPPAPLANEELAGTPAPLPEPKGPIDPKSVEAAGQVVQHYGALIERSRWLKAEKLWGEINQARNFAEDLGAQFREVHLEIGDLGDTEGAAGSIYTTVPVVFYGQSRKGEALRLPASVTLRRVNDVPGSTERQRQWHIERIEWKGRA